MSTALVPIETLGAEIKARIEAGDKALDKAEQHYIAAGIQLAEAKRRLTETREMSWSAFLNAHCAVRRRRADEIIAISDGRTSLAQLREANRERVAAHRQRQKESALRNAEPCPPVTASIDRPDDATPLLAAWENADDEERQDFLRAIRSDINDWYVPKSWWGDMAVELHLARGTRPPEAFAKRHWFAFGEDPPPQPPA